MTTVWAHRGASMHFPENTLPAFQNAIDLDSDGIELDVQLTSDGHVVVCHDETVDRTTDGHGPIVSMTLEQVRSLNAAAHTDHPRAQIPLLDEVLDLLAPSTVGLNIELKNSVERYPGLVDAVARVIDAHHMADRIVISSFNHRCMAEVAERTHNGVERAILYADDIADPWDYARHLDVQAVHPGAHLLVGRDDVAKFHDAGLRVRTWTLDSPDHLRAAQALGVDAVITNDPATARQVLA
ncbi:glycerophosphodiester phosphodiesterase family protein [Cutibacterium equinum]|uniref:Glycerophosphodiester phosphodiesterase family protein n=1 Tax=Cutibacterium equinum TaxID=3016342 RepID=A0ABY7QZA0_9ACTN|nr:glycerophosphodiester phosphodiesterase family protein [Cutibacterium equinum]WCC79857.1 glycerophosphodiester phosphodiesterase family protein [Cutibacterium equinum]